jgi:hypothetical protein
LNVKVVPELGSLSGDALQIWTDAEVRRAALEAIVDAWERDRPELRRCVRRVDDAIVDGLRALGLPRGEVRSVEFVALGMRSTGRKAPDCRLVLNGDAIRAVIRQQKHPDGAFCTWVHESLHARQPYHGGAAAEYAQHRGY